MGINPPPPNKKKSHKCCKARGIESKVSCSKREQSCSGIESQRGQTIHEISKRKGRSSVLERLRQLGFRDSGSEITGCGSSEVSSDQRTDQTTKQAASNRKLWSGREIGGRMVGRVLHNPEENLGLFFWVAPPNPRVGLKIE